ncbi:40S ribosomal protein S18 [Perkinsela sp. CCAP 1560/4]|nr:40S ribosomal protein S18 [Perkinsela sp. CCAP 1560/4]|eukprot:KNH09261.1 40S ribosomal protein S18 [Perkinsela sp. CCAP 1560/4]
MSLSVITPNFTHIIRMSNTNLDGKRKVPYALRMVKGIGVRMAMIVTKKAGIDPDRRAGTLAPEELDRIADIIASPEKYKIPSWMLNRKKDPKTGKTEHVTSVAWDNKVREDLERLKKGRIHRGIRHCYGHRVRGQHTKTSGRHGRVPGLLARKR